MKKFWFRAALLIAALGCAAALSACGGGAAGKEETSAAAASESVTTASVQSEAEQPETSLPAYLAMRPDRSVQEDGSYLYALNGNRILRYEKDDLSVCEELFSDDDRDAPLRFAVQDGYLYVLCSDYVQTADGWTRTSEVIGISPEKEFLCRMDPGPGNFENILISDGRVILTGSDYNSGTWSGAEYEIGADGKISAAEETVTKTLKEIGTDVTFPVFTGMNGEYVRLDAAYQICAFDGRYCFAESEETPDGTGYRYTVRETDSASGETRDVGTFDGYREICGITPEFLILADTREDYQKPVLSRMDLKSGEEKTFFDPSDGAYRRAEILDYDEDAVYLALLRPENAADGGRSWDLVKAGFDGTNEVLRTFDEDLNNAESGEPFTRSAFGALSGGVFYIRYQDLVQNAFFLTEDGKETQLGKEALRDPGLSASGITLKKSNDVERYQKESFDREIAEIRLSLPVLPETTDAAKKFNADLAAQHEKAAEDLKAQAVEAADDAVRYAAENPEDDSESYTWGFPFSYDCTLTDATYCDDDLICLKLSTSSYYGGAHGSSADSYYTLNRKTWESYRLSDLIGNSTESFKDIVREAMKRDLSEVIDSSDPDTVISGSMENYDTLDDFNWFLTEEGVGIEFGEYEIAAYAAGRPTLVIPREELQWKN